MTLKKHSVTFNQVSKSYLTYTSPHHKLLELLSNNTRQYAQITNALDDVTFELECGARLGIIGENGSGKSTLLKILAGVLTPSKGTVKVNGRISALLELGAGFNAELSGIENIRQFCMLHNISKQETEKALPEIINFSELSLEVINHPIKTYSSGMAVRLGFACAVYVKPDILIVDEALSVGDAYFQNKCLHKIKSLLEKGVTFIYVTHAADSIRSLCDQAIWMEHGKIRMLGKAKDVGAAYQSYVFDKFTQSGVKIDSESNPTNLRNIQEKYKQHLINENQIKSFEERVAPLRKGSGEALIKHICVINDKKELTDSIDFNNELTLRVTFVINKQLSSNTSVTLGITDNSGKQILHFNANKKGIDFSKLTLNELHTIEIKFDNQLCPGEYGLIGGIGSLSTHPSNPGKTVIDKLIDYCAGGARFSISHPSNSNNEDLWGVFHVPYKVQLLTN